jgi:hypothetical protein
MYQYSLLANQFVRLMNLLMFYLNQSLMLESRFFYETFFNRCTSLCERFEMQNLYVLC